MEHAASRLVYVLPRLKLSTGKYGQKEIRIGRAEFWPDEEATWANAVGKPRPTWLDVFREFPALRGDQHPQIARGTIAVADDDEWLRENAPKAVPVLYYLGLSEVRWQAPVEAFQYYEFRATDTPARMVSFSTKYGPLLEDERSLQAFPPLALRCNVQFRARTEERLNVELIRRFSANPNDRIVVACRHLFRTQFADPFLAPFDQDEAAYCACLEAVLGIAATQREIGKELAKRLEAIYGALPGFREWVEGLYASRCDFVHGDSGAVVSPGSPHKQNAYESFQARRGKWTVLRSLCRDVIRHQLEQAAGISNPVRFQNEDEGLIEGYFCSDELWSNFKKHVEGEGAATTILSLSGDALTSFCKAASNLLQIHQWHCMKSLPSAKRVASVLRSVQVTILNCPGLSQEDKNDALGVSRSAAEGDTEAVKNWIAYHEEWQEYGRGEPMASYLKAILLHVARFFESP
jgi:hypothetical protein